MCAHVCKCMPRGKLTLGVVAEPGGQGAVAPPVLGSRPVAGRRRWGEESALLVLLEQLAGEAGMAG